MPSRARSLELGAPAFTPPVIWGKPQNPSERVRGNSSLCKEPGGLKERCLLGQCLARVGKESVLCFKPCLQNKCEETAFPPFRRKTRNVRGKQQGAPASPYPPPISRISATLGRTPEFRKAAGVGGGSIIPSLQPIRSQEWQFHLPVPARLADSVLNTRVVSRLG